MIFSQKIFKRAMIGAAFLMAGASLVSMAKADGCEKLKTCYNITCKRIHPSNICRASCDRIAKHEDNMSEDAIQQCVFAQ